MNIPVKNSLKFSAVRKQWIDLRKNKNKTAHEVLLQKLLGLVMDKTAKLAKADKSDSLAMYLDKAIQSEYKQQLDSLSKGVDCETEIKLLKDFLPKTLTREETTEVVNDIISKYKNPNMGLIMKELKNVPDLDMKLASSIVKEIL